MNTKPESNPYLPRVNSQRLLNLLDVGHNAPATGIVTKPVRMGVAGDFRFPDADRDGVPDLFDCEPFNPEADGWLGDIYSAAKSYFKVDYAAAARRRASVRRAVSGGARAASSYGRAAVSYVRRAPARPSQVIPRHVARQITMAAVPMIKRIASRPSPEQLKRVTAAAFPKTAAMITGAAELRKVVGAMRPPSGAELVQAGATAFPKTTAMITAAVAAKHGAEYVGGGIRQISQDLEVDYDYAAQQRKKVMGAGWGATGQVLTSIAEMGEPFRERLESQVVATTVRQQAKFPEGVISPVTRGFSEQTQQVAGYVREVEQPTEQWMLGTEERLGLHSERIPESLRWFGGQAKRFGYGAVFTMPSGTAEMVGMVPVAVEAAWKRKDIIPSAIAVGYHTMGKSMYHSAVTDPARMAGEFMAYWGLGKALPTGKGKVETGKAKPAPTTTKTEVKITKSPEAKGVSIGLETQKGGVTTFEQIVSVTASKKAPLPELGTTRKAVTPEKFLRFEQKAGRIEKDIHTKSPLMKEYLGSDKVHGAILSGKVSKIYVEPIAYAYPIVRFVGSGIQKTPFSRLAARRIPHLSSRGSLMGRFPTHQETLAHELYHYLDPKRSEIDVKLQEIDFALSPTKKLFEIDVPKKYSPVDVAISKLPKIDVTVNIPVGKTAPLSPTTLTSTPVSQSALVSELAHGYAAHLKYRLISHAIGERGGAVSRKMATLVTKHTAEPHKGVMQDLLALPKEEALKFSTGFEATRRLMHAESPISRPLDFTKITAFPGKSGKVVESWILKHPEQRTVVYGGAASRVHMKGSRTIGDIDMGVMDVKQAAREIAADLRTEIGAKNVRTSYDPKWKASKVWVRSDGEWVVGVDLAPVSKMYSTLKFGLLTQPHEKVGGITYTTLGEQLARKAESVYMPRGGKVRPRPHRAAKDITDIDALYDVLADQPIRSWYQRSSLPPIPYLRATFQPPKIPKIPRTQVISSASVGALGVPSSATTQALPAVGIGSIFGAGATLAGLGTMAHTFNLQKPETAWEAVSLATKQHTKPFGLYGAPIEHREYQEAIKDYEVAHAASMDLSKAYDEKFGGMGTATDAQVAAANRMIHEIEVQNRKAEEAYAEVLLAEEKYREGRAGMSIPSLQEISDAGAPFREKHKKGIDVIRGGYEKYSPKYAKDVIYPAIGYGLSYGIPTLQKISDAGAPFREEHKKEIDQIRGLVQTVGKLPAMPMLAPFEMAVGRKPTTLKDIHPYVAGYTIGEYEEFQKHPLRWAVTTVGLAALTPALKGVGWAGKAVGVTGLVGKVPVVGVPIVKYATPALFAGMGAMWLTSIAGEYEKAKTPFEKGKLTGRLMISDVIPFALAPGLSKPVGRVLKYPVTKVGEATGLIRQKTIVHKIPSPDVGGASLPAQSATQQVEMLISGKWVKGATGVPYAGKAPHTAFTTVQVGALEEVGLELVAKGAGHHLVPMPKAGTLQLSTVFLRGAKAVEVPPALKRKIYKSIQETGGFEREYPEIVRLAHAQSRKLGQPVAIPSEFRMSPGGSFGGGAWAESEMVLIFGSKKAKEVASSRFVGFTERGDVIKQITYGTQPKIPKLKKLSFIPENIGYNVQKQKKYLEAMTEHAQRKHEELYGDALSYPGAYGGHGRAHAEDVLLKMESIWSKSPALQKKYRKEVLEAAAKLHDIYKVRDVESEPLRHALAAERGISKGLLRDIPELAVLTKSELKIVAHAVGLHTKVDPGIVSRTWHQPSDLAKMLATADRLALERYGITVNPRKLFSFGEPTTQAKGLVSLKTAEVAALVGGVIVGGSAPPIRGKGGFMTIIEPVKTTKTPSKTPKYSQVSTRDTYRPVAQKRRYYRDMPGDISGYGRYSVTPKRGYYPVAPKRGYYSVAPKKGYYPVAPKKGYYPVAPKGDYYPVPPKGDYYPVPPKGEYYPVPPKDEYYPVPPEDEYYPVPPEDDYYPVPPTEEKVPPPPEEPRPERRPPPTKTPKIPKEDKRRRKVRGEREEYEWHIGNPLITLDEFFASPPQSKKPVKSKNMIPMIPAGVV